MNDDNRIRYLNGLRGLLALVVFLHHFFFTFCPDLVFGGSYQELLTGNWTFSRFFAYTPLNLIFNPGAAINAFFLLSGYVQSYQYVKTRDPVFLQKSFLKRYPRLAFPVLLSVILLFLLHHFHLIYKNQIPNNPLTHNWVESMLPDSLDFLGAIRYGFISALGGDTSYFQVIWTMNIELKNSLMILTLLLVTHGLRYRTALFASWALILVFFFQDFYGLSFMLGLLLCHLQLTFPKFQEVFSSFWVKMICLLVGLYFSSYPYTGFEHAAEKSIYAPISFFDTHMRLLSYLFGNLLLFLCLLHSRRSQALLSKPVFLFFGALSFMFYLLHFLVLFSFSPWLYTRLLPGLVFTANMWITGLCSFALITGLAWLFYSCVDAPVLKYCNRLAGKLFRFPLPDIAKSIGNPIEK